MTQTTLDLERQVPPTLAEPAPRGRRPAWPLVAMAAGLAIIAGAGTVLVDHAGRRPAPVSNLGLTAGDVSVVTQVYGAGEESGWHSHSGIHAVAVLSGVLTVYDGDCRRQTFEAGRPYVGGQDAHLVRNEGDEPVVMAVTYVNPPAAGQSTHRLAPPSGCRA